MLLVLSMLFSCGKDDGTTGKDEATSGKDEATSGKVEATSGKSDGTRKGDEIKTLDLGNGAFAEDFKLQPLTFKGISINTTQKEFKLKLKEKGFREDGYLYGDVWELKNIKTNVTPDGICIEPGDANMKLLKKYFNEIKKKNPSTSANGIIILVHPIIAKYADECYAEMCLFLDGGVFFCYWRYAGTQEWDANMYYFNKKRYFELLEYLKKQNMDIP